MLDVLGLLAQKALTPTPFFLMTGNSIMKGFKCWFSHDRQLSWSQSPGYVGKKKLSDLSLFNIDFSPFFLSVSVLIFNTTSHCFVLVKQFRPGKFLFFFLYTTQSSTPVVLCNTVYLFSSCRHARSRLLYISCGHFHWKSNVLQSLFIQMDLNNNAVS